MFLILCPQQATSPVPVSTPQLPLPAAHQHNRTSSGIELGSHRSSGDGGSEADMEDATPYATLKVNNNGVNPVNDSLEEEDEEEESHYSLIRQPDGRADDPAYSPLA